MHRYQPPPPRPPRPSPLGPNGGPGGGGNERFVCTTAPLFFFGVLMQAKCYFLPLESWILPTRQIGVRRGQKWSFRVHHSTIFFFRRSHVGETLLFALAIMDSATSCFLIFSRSLKKKRKRGRRQLPQAGEVRRPLGPAWVCGWFAYSFLRAAWREQARGRGLVHTHLPAPPPPAAPLEPARSKWGFGEGKNGRFVCTTAPFFFSAFSCRPEATFCPCDP